MSGEHLECRPSSTRVLSQTSSALRVSHEPRSAAPLFIMPSRTGAREGLRAVLRELHKLVCCSPPHKRRASQRKLESASECKRWRHAPHCACCAPRKSGETHPKLLRHIWKVHAEARDDILQSMLLATGAVRNRNWRCAACTAIAGAMFRWNKFDHWWKWSNVSCRRCGQSGVHRIRCTIVAGDIQDTVHGCVNLRHRHHQRREKHHCCMGPLKTKTNCCRKCGLPLPFTTSPRSKLPQH